MYGPTVQPVLNPFYCSGTGNTFQTATALLVVTAHSLACVTGEEEENERSVVFEWIHVRHSSPYVSEISKKQQLPFSPVKTWSD